VKINRHPFVTLALVAIVLCLAAPAHARGTATDVTGLYYTGVDNNGAILAGGARDSHWDVVYASVGGNSYTGNSTYTGDPYVLSPSYIDGAYVANSSTSKWITAPGANTAASGGTANIGGDYLPGNGVTGTNSAQYVYRLAFTITGTGSGNVRNDVSISLTLAADDQYSVYVNPATFANGSVDTGGSTLAGSRSAAWNNTSALYLQNFDDSNGANNSRFVIGTNYIYVVVDNTNSQTGTSSSSSLNPSGLLVYQVGNATTIDGKPVPEVGTWLPVVAALGVFGWRRQRRRSKSEVAT